METELILVENPQLGRDDVFDEFFDDEDEEPVFDDIIGIKKPRRKNTMSNPTKEEFGIEAILAIGGLGYLIWCAFAYKKTQVWSWQPWKAPQVIESRRLARLAANNQQKNNGYDPNRQIVTLIVP